MWSAVQFAMRYLGLLHYFFISAYKKYKTFIQSPVFSVNIATNACTIHLFAGFFTHAVLKKGVVRYCRFTLFNIAIKTDPSNNGSPKLPVTFTDFTCINYTDSRNIRQFFWQPNHATLSKLYHVSNLSLVKIYWNDQFHCFTIFKLCLKKNIESVPICFSLQIKEVSEE